MAEKPNSTGAAGGIASAVSRRAGTLAAKKTLCPEISSKLFYAVLTPLLLATLLFCTASFAAEGAAPRTVTGPGEAFVTGSIVVKGEGAAPRDGVLSPEQRRLMALRAAKVVALREASEIIDGVYVSADKTVVAAASESEAVRTAVQGIVKGARVVSESYDASSDSAVVFLSVPVTGPDGLVNQLLPKVLATLEKARQYSPQARIAPRAGGDGLIIDVRGLDFRPALINRVVSKDGGVIYGPERVAGKILAERGAAEYTNDIGKARAILAERGSRNPMVVKGAGLSRPTDVEIGEQDAGAVFSSNQASNYLEGAKVVFVLK